VTYSSLNEILHNLAYFTNPYGREQRLLMNLRFIRTEVNVFTSFRVIIKCSASNCFKFQFYYDSLLVLFSFFLFNNNEY